LTDAAAVAVWGKSRVGASGSGIEAHFNYWSLRNEKPGKFLKARQDFLEVGVWLDDPSSVDDLRLYLPLYVDRVEDLGTHFGKPIVVQGIFNEVLKATLAPQAKWVELTDQSGHAYCRVGVLPVIDGHIAKDHVALVHLSQGTVVTLTNLAIDTCSDGRSDPLYFRLRFPLPPKNPFIKVSPPLDRFFVSGYDEIQFIDFRLNDARTLPADVESLMRPVAQQPTLDLRKVAFLTAVQVAAQVSIRHEDVHKVRRLETEVWNSYVPDGIPEGMVVYHWKLEKPKIEDFSAFVKLQTRRSNWLILITYLAIALIFGVLGNLFATTLERKWPLLVQWADAPPAMDASSEDAISAPSNESPSSERNNE
jgi:hypothetical protein